MSLKQRKFDKVADAIQSTERSATSTIRNLSVTADEMIKQQCYLRMDPDQNMAGELLPVVSPKFAAQAAAFNEVAQKLADMQAVATGAMPVAELATKYNVDVESYSQSLI